MTRGKQSPDYEVGYGKPPKAAQWRKGQSGNPKGRKPRPNTVLERIHELLDRRVPTTTGELIPYSDAILRVAINGLMDRTKSVKTSLELIRFLREFDTRTDFVPDAADEERLQQLLGRVRQEAERAARTIDDDAKK